MRPSASAHAVFAQPERTAGDHLAGVDRQVGMTVEVVAQIQILDNVPASAVKDNGSRPIDVVVERAVAAHVDRSAVHYYITCRHTGATAVIHIEVFANVDRGVDTVQVTGGTVIIGNNHIVADIYPAVDNIHSADTTLVVTDLKIDSNIQNTPPQHINPTLR